MTKLSLLLKNNNKCDVYDSSLQHKYDNYIVTVIYCR